MADRVQQPRHGHLELGNSCVDAVGANDKLTAVKMSDEAGTKKDKVIVTIDEHRPESVADRDDKTPPPEVDDLIILGPIIGQSQRLFAYAIYKY